MQKCLNCGNELPGNAKFCVHCGSEQKSESICTACGSIIAPGFSFCGECGMPVAATVPDESQADAEIENGQPDVLEEKPIFDDVMPVESVFNETDLVDDSAASKDKKKYPKWITVALIAVAACAAIVATAVFVLPKVISQLNPEEKNQMNYALYLKDQELHMAELSGENMEEITDNLFDDEETAYSYDVQLNVAIRANGNRLFYPEQIDGDQATIYYRDLDDPEMEPIKIDTHITLYMPNGEGTQVAYLKDTGALYLYDAEGKTKLAGDVFGFYATEDLQTIGYIDKELDVYIWQAGGDTEKVISDIDDICYISADFSSVYYIKNSALYKYEIATDQQIKIATDIEDNTDVYECETGEVYFTKQSDRQLQLKDYIEDDMAESDAAIKEPEYPTYPDYPSSPQRPSWWDYDTDAQYQAAYDAWLLKKEQYEKECEQWQATCDRLKAEYQEKYNAYQAKLQRDEAREELSGMSVTHNEYALYCYDGNETSLVVEGLTSSYLYYWAEDAAVAVVRTYDASAVEKTTLSDALAAISDSDNVDITIKGLVNEAFDKTAKEQLVIGKNLYAAEHEDAQVFRLAADGSAVFYLADIEEESAEDEGADSNKVSTAILYRAAIAEGKIQPAETYDTDVSTSGLRMLENTPAYFKDYNSDTYSGDIYVAGTLVDYDVYSTYIYSQGERIFYFTDFDRKNAMGTLKVFENGIATELGTDVRADYTMVVGSESVLYIGDWDKENKTGTLYSYKDGVITQLDEDVSALLWIPQSKITGGLSSYIAELYIDVW